jgi:hypothetical protein
MALTLPAIEVKFSRAIRNAAYTRVLLRMYRLDDGGLDGQGNQIYLRTLLRERDSQFDAGITKAELLAIVRTRLQDLADELGYVLTADRVICTL